MLVAAAPAAAAKKKDIYVSLGDSLAWGYSKKDDGTVFQSDKGWSDLLAAAARTNKRYSKKLKLKNFACPGESTESYLKGGKPACPQYSGGKSQHSESLKFIKKNRKRIAFITINVVSNNFLPCAPGGAVDLACIQKGTADMNAHLPKIYRELRKAAGKNAKIANTTLYNPFLALSLRGSEYSNVVTLSNDLTNTLSQKLRALGKKRKFRVADVFRSFKTLDLSTTTTLNGRQLPVAVATICTHTFMCRPAPVGPDPHLTDTGNVNFLNQFKKALQIK